MAPGNQKWNGAMADFDSAPTMTSTMEIPIYGTSLSSAVAAKALSSENRHVPVVCPSNTMPTSIVRPPSTVTIKAWPAARREEARSP